nr:putative ribonuclease H-like domain-containing protein [Tanacetum cinerariifolium]
MPSCMENLRRKSIWTPFGICGKFESKRSVSFEEILILTEAVSSSLVWQVHFSHEKICNDKEETTRLRTNLFKEFEMKDLGRLKYFLGIEVLSPSKRHLFTIMNCDFLKTEYFYNTQHTGQEEKEYNDALSWLKWMSSSKETSHTSLPQSTDPGNSTTNDDISILMSKVRNPQTQTQECVNSPTDSSTVSPTLSDANIDCETYENNKSP